MDNTLNVCVGSFNEKGFLKNLNRKGFTTDKCLCELIANSIDASAKNIRFVIYGDKYIFMLDDGKGMDNSSIGSMFDMYRENHETDKSMGVSGFGGKNATLQLSTKHSKPTTVIIYTRKDGDKYIKVTVPWDTIFENFKYNDMIKISDMTSIEINEFIQLRKQNDIQNDSGTTIKFEFNNVVHECLEQQFVHYKTILLHNQFGKIFGKTSTNISYKKNNDVIKLKKYNYFKKDIGWHDNYYCGVTEIRITHYTDETGADRYIYENDDNLYSEFLQKKINMSRKLEPISSLKVSEFTLIGHYTITIGMKKDNNMFDEENVQTANDTLKSFKKYIQCDNNSTTPDGGYTLHPYDLGFVGLDSNKDYYGIDFSCTSLYRNNQCIHMFEVDGFKHSSARGNEESYIKTKLVRSEIEYETVSSQVNKMDEVMGIQENKNQHSGKFPTQLDRYLQHFKTNKWHEIKKYFDEKLSYCAPVIPEEPIVTEPIVEEPIVIPEEPVIEEPIIEDPVVPEKPIVIPEKPILPKEPIIVNEHIKGSVLGRQLVGKLEDLLSKIDPDKKYDGSFIEFYNSFNKLEF
jgi:hypothetical protein